MIDISTGKNMTRGGFLKGILATGVAPSIVALAGSANATVRRGLGARLGANFNEGEEEDTGMTKGLFISSDGIAVNIAGTSNFVPIVGNCSLSAKLNSLRVSICLVEYKSDFTVNDYWNIPSTRTFNIKADTAYIRFTVQINDLTAYVLNNTTGKYIYKDGKLVTE